MLSAANVPVIPDYQMTYLSSARVLKFNTPTGFLEPGYYAENEHGNGYYIKVEKDSVVTKVNEQTKGLMVSYYEHIIELPKLGEYSKLKEAKITGKQYITKFVDKDINVYRDKITEKQYKDIFKHKTPAKTKYKTLLEPRKADAAITIDASSNSGVQILTDAFTFNHTTGSGSDRLMVFGVGSTDDTDADREVLGVDYNVVGGTTVRQDDNNTDNLSSYIAYLKNPDSGTNAVGVAFAGGVSFAGMAVSTVTGVHQTSTLDAQNGMTQTDGDTATLAVTTVADNSWVFTVAVNNVGLFYTIDSDQTDRAIINGNGGEVGLSSLGPKTPAGSASTVWSEDSPASVSDWAISGASFAPTASPAAALNSPPILFE